MKHKKEVIYIDRTLYTIGHTKHSQQYFLKLLTANNINCIADVRSTPFSKFCPQFNQNEIKMFLNKHGIYYIPMGEEFGARQKDMSLYTTEGYLDFEKTAKSDNFLTGIERISTGIDKGLNIAFMCTEKDPIDCHRNILVANAFYKNDYKIQNILANGDIENQEHLQNRLLDMYFPDRAQLTFIDVNRNTKTEVELIKESYRLRNKEIGYNINKSKE